LPELDNPANRETAVAIFQAALASADPCRLVQNHCPAVVDAYRRGNCRRLMLAAFGKAAFAMTRALTESPVGELVTRGTVITKYGHVPGTLPDPVAVYEAGHPLPDAAGVAATGRLVRMLEDPDPQTLVVCLISGGGSALLVAPGEGLTLAEKQETTQCLLEAGADIGELNAVRKHISAIKGGRLAALAYPARVLSLILSDVIGDPLDVIASGPTAPDNTTFADALAVIEKYGLAEKIPASVYRRLIQGQNGAHPETPAKDDPVFADVANVIIGATNWRWKRRLQKPPWQALKPSSSRRNSGARPETPPGGLRKKHSQFKSSARPAKRSASFPAARRLLLWRERARAAEIPNWRWPLPKPSTAGRISRSYPRGRTARTDRRMRRAPLSTAGPSCGPAPGASPPAFSWRETILTPFSKTRMNC
jgi:hypothetical protein